MEIVCTIGPATNSPSMVRKLWCAGVTIFRLNLSYTNEMDEIKAFIGMVRTETGAKTCLDTHGKKFCPPSSDIDFTNFDARAWTKFVESVDQFAISFAQSAKPIEQMRLKDKNMIIAKIEDKRGVNNKTEIIDAADIILIDRGDLSKSFPPEEIPRICREIILTCKGMKTPVWVATNLLESMVGSPQPTQAEVNDIATLLMLGVDGLVLAAETAIGKYPIECVQFVRKMVDLYHA